jgi:E3 ubiquitin-protein ligase RNF14
MIQEYLKADSAGRSLLEFRYGRHLIHRLVAEHEREQASKQWIRSSTTSCPGCQSNVEKGMGCNHVRKLFSFLHNLF